MSNITPHTLETWLEYSHNKFRPFKYTPKRLPKPSKARTLSAKEFAVQAREHGLISMHTDNTTAKAKLANRVGYLEFWLDQMHSPNWKYKPYSAPKPKSFKLTPAQRQIEESKIANYVNSRKN